MLKKVVTIRNVGKLEHCQMKTSATWDGTLAKTTLIFADNGAGKTTLATVIASLCRQDPSLLAGRRTLGAHESPYAELITTEGLRKFENGQWDGRLDRVEVFDADFVAKNVHSGYHVSAEQKQGICEFSLGEEAVRFAKRIDGIDDSMRDVDTKLNRLEKRLKPHIQGSMSCSEFVALQPVLDVQERTRNQELVVSRMENAEAIRTKGSLREVKIPTVNRAALEGTLARSLDDIDKESVQLVKKYVERALDENGEDWLSYGAERVKGNRCPFCGQAVRDCRLVEAYREYFSRAYREFKTELTRAAGDVEAAFSVDARAAVMETIAANSGPWEFWQAHVKQEITTPDRDALTRLWTDAAEAIKGVLARKSSNPLKPIPPASVDKPIRLWGRVEQVLEAYNASVEAANAEIASVKKLTASGDLTNEQELLARLGNQAARHCAPADTLSEEYAQLLADKLELSQEKAAARVELDRHLKEFAETYEENLNGNLRRLGTDIEIARAASALVNYKGRKPNLDYCLRIRGVAVPLGKQDTPPDTPSFRNTLSEGDKGALALKCFTESGTEVAFDLWRVMMT